MSWRKPTLFFVACITMAKGHPGVKRSRDPAQFAKLMIDIASGEVEDREPESKAEPPAKNTPKAKSPRSKAR